MHFRHTAFAMLFMACGGSGSAAHEPARGTETTPADMPDAVDDDEVDPATEPPPVDLGLAVPYDRAIQKSVHNAYERAEPLLDQLVYHRVRSIELDIHVQREGIVAPAADWFVFHEDAPLLRNTSCAQLSDCLALLSAFHHTVPRHEVVTLFVDLKDSFGQGHSPADLDAAITTALGRENVLAPSDLLAACPGAETLRDAVTGDCAFPTLGSLRGKFIVATTGGTLCQDSLVARYAGDDARARLAFAAPNLSAQCPAAPEDKRADIVFYNLAYAERARAADVRAQGLVVRFYGGGVEGGLDSPADFAGARAAGGVHLATDKVSFDRDAWAATHGPRGFPFACDGCADSLVEEAAVLGARATTGDLWGTADSGFFAVQTSSSDAAWSALVSVPSSHVEPFAKACLVARASEEPNAANVSVCRTFDGHPPRAQLRPTAGATTIAVDAPPFDGHTGETPAFLRLEVKSAGAGSEVTAATSIDGKTWVTITKTATTMPLPVRGIALSSHGPAEVKGLFSALTKREAGTVVPIASATLTPRTLGADASGIVFDGIFAP